MSVARRLGVMSGGRPMRVLLVVQSPLLREALCAFLALQADIDPIGVNDFGDVLGLLAGVALVLLAVQSADADIVRVMRGIREASATPIAVFASDPRPTPAALAIAAEADGYIDQGTDPHAFLEGIRRIGRGLEIVGEDGVISDNAVSTVSPRDETLTKREQEVISLVAKDLTAQQIASSLAVSVRTVHVHLQHVYRKLGVHGRMSAVRAAECAGLLANP
jgi:two-component system, NarL family, nitrate/nitrite response regulator NarL